MEDFIMEFIVETSARHAHISEEHLKVLFGEGAELVVKKMLSQPGQYASEQKIQVVGPKGSLMMSILGPTRKDTQIEVSLSDARTLGVKALIRESGDIKGTAGCKIVGPCGEVELTEGVIAAKRHIHATTKDAAELGVTNGEIVNVEVKTEGRSLIYGDVVVRVSDSYALAMHIDTDEANAAACSGVVYGRIVK
jgi:putative phosphotransacetylase